MADGDVVLSRKRLLLVRFLIPLSDTPNFFAKPNTLCVFSIINNSVSDGHSILVVCTLAWLLHLTHVSDSLPITTPHLQLVDFFLNLLPPHVSVWL